VITSLGEWVGLCLVWILPVFWMALYRVRRPTLNWLFQWQVYATISVVVMEILPQTHWVVVELFPSHRLLLTYTLLITAFTAYLVYGKGWNYLQAVSISALVAFVGSYYWEAPYLIRNAFITGPQWDWGLHVLVVFPLWFLTVTTGWTRAFGNLGRWVIFLVGLAVATLFLLGNPVPYGVISAEVWDSPYYLVDRVICTSIAFLLVNKEVVE